MSILASSPWLAQAVRESSGCSERDSLWKYEELDETDEAKNQKGTGDIGSKARIYLPGILWEER